MSLVVGRVVGEQVFLLADTELTYRSDRQQPMTEGCLKVYRIQPNLALGFAGDVADFGAYFSRVRNASTAEELLTAGLNAYAAGARFDLLVAEAQPGRLHVLKSGVREVTGAGFVGDAPAYGRYQQYFHEAQTEGQVVEGRALLGFVRLPEPTHSADDYNLMLHSLARVVGSREFPSVGGLVVPLCTDKGTFTFMNYAAVVSDLLRPEDFAEQPRRIAFGTAEGGGYQFEFAPSRDEPTAIGFYLPPGEFGAVFQPDETGLQRARLLRARTPAHWSVVTQQVLGHEIPSSFCTADHCGSAGEEYLSMGRPEEATFCYRLRNASELSERPAVRDRYLHGLATALFQLGRETEASAILSEARLSMRPFPREALHSLGTTSAAGKS